MATVGELKIHASTLLEMASALLTGLADGKYDSEVTVTEEVLSDLSIILPPAALVDHGLELFLELNKLGAFGRLGPVVPDGFGREVSKAWADDPRHQLNPDGTFKY